MIVLFGFAVLGLVAVFVLYEEWQAYKAEQRRRYS